MNYSNIRLLYFRRMSNNEDNIYIFLLSEDKYQYTIALYNCLDLTYIVHTINKITRNLKVKKEDILNIEELNDIIKDSKNIEEYKCDNHDDYKNDIIAHIRKIKIGNICY